MNSMKWTAVGVACLGVAGTGYAGWRTYDNWWWSKYGGLVICARVRASFIEHPPTYKMNCGNDIAFDERDMFIRLVEKYQLKHVTSRISFQSGGLPYLTMRRRIPSAASCHAALLIAFIISWLFDRIHCATEPEQGGCLLGGSHAGALGGQSDP